MYSGKKILTSAALALVAFAGMALSAETYTLANGKKIVDPYVISKRPDGLEIGHKAGIMFIKFEMLPEKLQKKYNYDPKKAEAYEAAQKKRKAQYEAAKKEQAAKKGKLNKEMEKRRFEYEKERLAVEIVKTEKRIAYLKSEIDRMRSENNKMLDKSTKLAGTSVSGDKDRGRRYINNDYGWDGGYVVVGGNSGGRYAETTKRFTMRKFGNEYAINKRRIKTYERELEIKETELVRMKLQLQKSKGVKK